MGYGVPDLQLELTGSYDDDERLTLSAVVPGTDERRLVADADYGTEAAGMIRELATELGKLPGVSVTDRTGS